MYIFCSSEMYSVYVCHMLTLFKYESFNKKS